MTTYHAPFTRPALRLPIKPLRVQLTNNHLKRLDGTWIRMRKDGDGYVSRHWRMRNGYQMKLFFRVSDAAVIRFGGRL